MKPLLILIRGLPGSGKTTLAYTLRDSYLESGRDAIALAADDYMEVNGVYTYDPERLAECHFQCQLDAEQFLERGYVVIVHNTFTRHWEMEAYKLSAGHAKAEMQEITVKGPWLSVHGVPETVVQNMKERFEP